MCLAKENRELRKRRWSEWNDWYRPSTARRVKGGIKAHSRRGTFGETWWGRRWIEALEDMDVESRLSRGKSYARRGQVADLDIEAGEVWAKVQGSRTKPYKVLIAMEAYTERERSKIARAMSLNPLLAAQLAAGRMPAKIGEFFEELNLPLFPDGGDDLETDCTCPDWSNPCKHIAAVHYLLAEALDRNPFLLFELRGLKRSDLFGSAEPEEPEASPEPEPLPADPAAFWGTEGEESTVLENVPSSPTLTAALPRSLGPFPFWRGTSDLMETLEPIYSSAAASALEVSERTAPTPAGNGEEGGGASTRDP